MEWLIAHYVIDLWSLIHLVGWAGAVYLVRRRTGWSWKRCVVLGLAAGFAWELIEPFTAEALFGFKEPALNRWLTDPLADGLGAALGAWAANLLKRR